MRHLLLIVLVVLIALHFLARPAFAAEIEATAPIVDPASGQIVGYRTSEQSVYFLLPRQWTTRENAEGRTAFVSSAGDGNVDVRFALTADYSSAAASVLEHRSQDPTALFFPLPRIYESLTLFLPAALGSIQAKLEPDGGFQRLPVGYYRIRLSVAQLRTLVELAHGGLTLTGAASISYRVGSQEIRSTLPVTISLNPWDLNHENPPVAQSPAAWLTGLLDNYELRHGGDLNGSYSLGGMMRVTLSQSLLTGNFLPGTYAVMQRGGNFQCEATGSPNFAGALSFVIEELGVEVRLDFSATLALLLDAQSLSVRLTRFDVDDVVVNGQVSSFYRQLINNFLSRSDVRAQLSTTLTRELQQRILSQTLFGIEEELL